MSAADHWEFVVVRIRDDYNTLVTVPKSECPTLEQARGRVEAEFDPGFWRIGAVFKRLAQPDSNRENQP